MAHYPQINGPDVRVGDIITVIGGGEGAIIFSHVRVHHIDLDNIAVEDKDNKAQQDAFDPLDSYWKFYLVERPKKPLPTKLGSVVEANGQTWVLCDPDDDVAWRSTEGSWESAEELQEYDFTVV